MGFYPTLRVYLNNLQWLREHKNDTLLFQNIIKNTKKLLFGSWGHFAPFKSTLEIDKIFLCHCALWFFTQLWGSIWRTSNHFTNIKIALCASKIGYRTRKSCFLGHEAIFSPVKSTLEVDKILNFTVYSPKILWVFSQLWRSIWKTFDHLTNIQYNSTLKVIRVFVCLCVCLFVAFFKKSTKITKKIMWEQKKKFFEKKSFENFLDQPPPKMSIFGKIVFFWKKANFL